MRLLLRLIFFILGLVLFKYYTSSAPIIRHAEEQEQESEISFFEGRFQDHLNGYSLRRPGKEWKFEPSPRSKDLIKLGITHKSGKYGLQVRIYQKNNLGFDEFLNQYIENFKNDMQNPAILSRSTFQGDGINGVAISFDGRKRNGYFLKSWVFPGDRFYYALQGGCLFAQKGKIEPELDKIAASFKTE